MHEELVNLLSDFLGPTRKHNHVKGQVAFDCPVCSAEKGLADGDGKGNLEVNYYKGVYKCWSCYQTNHTSGALYYLVKSHGSRQNLNDFTEIAKELKFDLEFKAVNTEIITELPKEFQSLRAKSRNYEFEMAMAYLKERNIGPNIIDRFNLGYCATGKYAGRIIIPSYDADGNVNYFSGRAYKKWIKPKYLNPDTDKTTIIFNESRINWDATIYLVEGPFDHLVVPNSVPLLGKYLEYGYLLLEKLIENSSAMIIIVLDGDAQKDAKRLYFRLNTGKLRNRVKVVTSIPDEYDISKIHELKGPRGVLMAISRTKRIPDCEEIY